MNYIYIGEIVNTHGIKGELRILSDFEHKNLVFLPKFQLYVGKRKEKMTITSYRTHKNYDMVTFEGVNDLNDAIAYKGDPVYINRDDIKEDVMFREDLIGMEVYNGDNYIGNVDNILKSSAHDILVIKGEQANHMVPFIDEFVKNIDLKNHKIAIETIEGLLNEN